VDVRVKVEALEDDGVGLGRRRRRSNDLGVDVVGVTGHGDEGPAVHRRLRECFARRELTLLVRGRPGSILLRSFKTVDFHERRPLATQLESRHQPSRSAISACVAKV
jgi:hypothetical protein